MCSTVCISECKTNSVVFSMIYKDMVDFGSGGGLKNVMGGIVE